MSLKGFNQGFDTDEFVDLYWQKKPMLIRQLLPDFKDPLSPEELAGLSMEAGTESRLIEGTDPNCWQLSEGPFTESRFTSLPEDGWTLLVQAVDQWHEPVQDLLHLFDFIPSWRFDDVMVSFAAHGAGVGPHYDFYDVFLVQGLGQRTWKIGKKCSSADGCVSAAGLSILKQFDQVEEFTLYSGDVLYIPPQFSHWGVSEGRSLCYSVGCRAPSKAEMLEGFSDMLIDRALPEDRYIDANPKRPMMRGEIKPSSLEESFNQLLKAVDNKENFYIWFGCNATLPKYPNLIEAPLQQISRLQLIDALKECCQLVPNPSSRFAFTTLPDSGRFVLFVDGESILLGDDLRWFGEALCNNQLLAEIAAQLLSTPTAMEHTLRLLNQGSLVIY